MENIAKQSQIRITVGLDETNTPVHLEWDADDNPNTGKPEAAKAMLLALFSRENLDTVKVDLWTKDMQVNEMDRFFFQTLRGLADTYFKATQNKDLAVDMQKFVHYFGEKTGVISND